MTVPMADIDYLYGVHYIVAEPSEEDLAKLNEEDLAGEEE